MSTLAGRLKEERNRLRFSQEEFAAAAGVTRRPYAEWEAGNTSPTATQLAALAAQGADVQYVITGNRRGDGIGESAVHQAVLDAVDLLSLGKKIDADQLARAVVKLLDKPSVSSVPQVAMQSVIHGSVGNQIGTNTAPLTVNVERKKK